MRAHREVCALDVGRANVFGIWTPDNPCLVNGGKLSGAILTLIFKYADGSFFSPVIFSQNCNIVGRPYSGCYNVLQSASIGDSGKALP